MAVAPEANMPTPNLEAVPFGLLTSVPGPGETPKRWEAGFVLKADSCEGAQAWDPCSSGLDRDKDSQEIYPEEVTYQPFMVYAPIECSSFGFESADYVGRAERLLDATASAAIEREFWTGEIIPANQSLMGTPNTDDHVLNPGGAADPVAVSPAQALILLSDALSGCLDGTRGVIHATTGMAEAWRGSAMIQQEGDRLVTGARGDIVIAGAGYPGTGPIGQPVPEADHTWVYATSMMNVIVGQPEVVPTDISEALDRRTNTVAYRGEQTAAAFHDGCCVFAVYVDLTDVWDISVVIPDTSLVLSAGQWSAAPGANAVSVVPAGAKMVVVRMNAGQVVLGGAQNTVVQVGANGATVGQTDSPLVLEAPADHVFPAISLTLYVGAGESGAKSANWTAFA